MASSWDEAHHFGSDRFCWHHHQSLARVKREHTMRLIGLALERSTASPRSAARRKAPLTFNPRIFAQPVLAWRIGGHWSYPLVPRAMPAQLSGNHVVAPRPGGTGSAA